jgi:hypothetical protein
MFALPVAYCPAEQNALQAVMAKNETMSHAGEGLRVTLSVCLFGSIAKGQGDGLGDSPEVSPMLPGHSRRPHEAFCRAKPGTVGPVGDLRRPCFSSLQRRHRTTEFRNFLAKIDAEGPEGLDVHLICDNYQSHRTAVVKTWMQNHHVFTRRLLNRNSVAGN